jgi:hypothetical protein
VIEVSARAEAAQARATARVNSRAVIIVVDRESVMTTSKSGQVAGGHMTGHQRDERPDLLLEMTSQFSNTIHYSVAHVQDCSIPISCLYRKSSLNSDSQVSRSFTRSPLKDLTIPPAHSRAFTTSRCIRNEVAVPTSLDVFTEEEQMLRDAGMFLYVMFYCFLVFTLALPSPTVRCGRRRPQGPRDGRERIHGSRCHQGPI